MRKFLDFFLIVVILPRLSFGTTLVGDGYLTWDRILMSPLFVLAGPILLYIAAEVIWLIGARFFRKSIDNIWALIAARGANAFFVSYVGTWLLLAAPKATVYLGAPFIVPIIFFASVYGLCVPWHRWVARETGNPVGLA